MFLIYLIILTIATPPIWTSLLKSDDLHPIGVNNKDLVGRYKRQEPTDSQGGKCVLPNFPKHGSYAVGGVKVVLPGLAYDIAFLNVTCHRGFIVDNGRSQLHCYNGIWSDPMPTCKRACRLRKHLSVEYRCPSSDPDRGSKICDERVPSGTIATPVCKAPDYYYPGQLDDMRCIDGSWDQIITCQPECGKIIPGGLTLVSGGRVAYRGELPWHAGIYTTTTTPYRQICGGSLVSTIAVISAAHCFWSDTDKLLPASDYAVAVGKIYRYWGNNRDDEAQKSEVAEIKITPYFKGAATNFQDDIAVVIVSTPFTYQTFIRPVCLDYAEDFNTRQLYDGNSGKVAGWGLIDKYGNTTSVLKVAKLPFVSPGRCYELSPMSFREYITSDKICAGYTNGTALCQGDSGGGLAFPAPERDAVRYYLRGVVSTAPRNEDLCNTNALTTFTQIIKHTNFIKTAIRVIPPPTETDNKECPSTQWRCDIDNCISSDKKCDGVPDCEDGSDEAETTCGSVNYKTAPVKCVLPSYPEHGTYTVAGEATASPGQSYGSAVLDISCNPGYGIPSDQRIMRCYEGVWLDKMPTCVVKSSAQESAKEDIKKPSAINPYVCLLPPYPEHGSYVVVGSPDVVPGQTHATAYLNVVCDPGYQIYGSSYVYCYYGAWSQVMPKCSNSICQLPKHPSVEYRCAAVSLLGYRICGVEEPSGAVVKPVCKGPDYYSPSSLSPMTCVNGSWDYIAKCKLDCGTVPPASQGLYGVGTNRLPWHASIFKSPNIFSSTQICGGSIIRHNIVISAAHCFPEADRKLFTYYVAAGKTYRILVDITDIIGQYSLVANIRMTPLSRGIADSYQNDIAIVTTRIPFIFNQYVRPVCIDFDEAFDRQQLNDTNVGKISTWGVDELNIQLTYVALTLKVVEMPYLNTEECRSTLPSFRDYITGDKICAGRSNGPKLCGTDAGSGLAFPASQDRNRFYVRAVLTSIQWSGDQCSSLNIFTHIFQHERFIRESID